jgi:tetratricopeptide (TPR) repeat protein
LDDLGRCYEHLGKYREAMDLYTQALAIARETGYRYGEATAVAHLGRAWLAFGDRSRAVTFLQDALTMADTTGEIEPAVEARSWLARAQLQLGDPVAALGSAAGRPELLHPPDEPMLRLLEGVALLALDRTEDSLRAFSDAITGADALLALAERNVLALEARALALSGLAVATGNPAKATEASEAFARVYSVTSAAGVVTDARRLFDLIAGHDQVRVLAGVRVEPG